MWPCYMNSIFIWLWASRIPRSVFFHVFSQLSEMSFPIFGHILASQFLLLIIQTTNYSYYWLYIQTVYLQLTRAFFIKNYHTQDSESVVFNFSLLAPGFRRKAASNLKTFKGSRHMPHGPFQMTSGTISITTPKLKWNEEGLGSVCIASLNRA